MADEAAAAAAAKRREEEARAREEEARAAAATLDKPANNYGRWSSMFLVVLGKYNLKDHVLSDVSYPGRSAWA